MQLWKYTILFCINKNILNFTSFFKNATSAPEIQKKLVVEQKNVFFSLPHNVLMSQVGLLKSIRVHFAAGSVEVKTVYITARSNAHVSNICGRAKSSSKP